MLRNGAKKGEPVRRYSREQVAKQTAFVYAALVQGVSSRLIKRGFAAEFPGVGSNRWNVIRARVSAELAQEDKERAGSRRSEALARLHARIRSLDAAAQSAQARGDTRAMCACFNAAARQEAIVADLCGTREPLKIEIETKQIENVTRLIGSMTVDQINASLQQYNQTMALADLARAQMTKVLN